MADHKSSAAPKKALPNTLGPIADMEHHLPSDWWETLFSAVYLKTDGDVVENQDLTRKEVDFVIESTGVKQDARILDLCCGQGRHTLEFSKRGYQHMTGLDRSRYLIRLARRRAKKDQRNIIFREGDARKQRFAPNSFDLVILMGNSFGYFEQSEDDFRLLSNIQNWLKSGSLLFLDLADGAWLREHFEKRSWEWVDQTHFVCRERSLSEDGNRLISREVVVNSEEGVISDQFYAERLYEKEGIAHLLRKAGFEQVRFHGDYITESERNQDLGMMAKRQFITAVVKHKAATVGKKKHTSKRVSVLLGDPRLPDTVKLEGRFNPDDLVVVARLKEALEGLTDMQFQYLDNHATMQNDLRRDPPDFVLNLCDEGFNNNAFHELHVPAFLELMDIPYSGAGPACLGLCYDKGLVSSIASDLGIPVPLETYIPSDNTGGSIPSTYPSLIKPVTGDSSIGITEKALVNSQEEAVDYLNHLRTDFPNRGILVQEFLDGPEYTVGIVGNPGFGYSILPILEVDYSGLAAELPPILTHASKWDPKSPYWTDIRYKAANASDEIQRTLTNSSILLFERLSCRDYARFDFRCDRSGIPKLLEVNPNPGWCWDGKFNLMADIAGYSYRELLGMILSAAQRRIEEAVFLSAAD